MTDRDPQNEDMQWELDEALFWFSGGKAQNFAEPITSIGRNTLSDVSIIMKGKYLLPPPENNRIVRAILDFNEGLIVPWGRIIDEIREKLGVTLEMDRNQSQIKKITTRERPPRAARSTKEW